MNYTITITLTDSNDVNGANHFNYAPGYLRVHVGDTVRFSCNRAFKVKFLYGSPFGGTTEFFNDRPGYSAVGTVAAGTVPQLYHYTVTAIGPDGLPYVDASCPTLDVL